MKGLSGKAVSKPILLAGFALLALMACAQKSRDHAVPFDTAREIQKRRAIVSAFLSDSDKSAGAMKDVPQQPDSATQALERSAWRNYYAYKSFGYEHRRRVFSWQLLS